MAIETGAAESIREQCRCATDEDLVRWISGEDRDFWIEAITAEQEWRNPSINLDIAGLIWTVRDTA